MKQDTTKRSGKPVVYKSLVTRLTWVVILMVALSLIISGTGLMLIAHNTQEYNAFRLQEQSAQQVSQLISGYMTRALDRIYFFLTNTSLSMQSREQQRVILENLLLTSIPLYSQIAIVDGQGNELTRVSRFHTFLPEELTNRSKSPAFNVAMSGKTYMGPVSFFEDTGLLSVTISHPIKTAITGIVGVLIADVNVSHLWQDVANVRLGSHGYAYLIDMKGRFVAYQNPSQVLQRYGEDLNRIPPVSEFARKGRQYSGQVSEYRGLIEENVIGICIPIENTDWAVLVEQPTWEAYASVKKMRSYLYLTFFICLFGSGFAAFWVSRRLSDPIRTLADAARRFGSGDLDAEFTEIQRQDEIGILSNAFKKMQGELQDLYAGLKGKVAELETTQSELKKSEERFRTLVEKSPLGISLIGKDGEYKYVNPQFKKIFGFSIDDIPTGDFWFKKAFPDRAQRREVIRLWITDQRKATIGQSRPRVFTVTCRDGSRKEIHFRSVTMENLDQFVIYEDITDKSRMEKELEQSRKFEAIGTLAGGIAHDFNNLLMGIQGHASLISLDLTPDSAHLVHIQSIEKLIESATDLTRQLLGFARGGKYEVKPVDINELVLASSAMFGRTRKEIRIHEDMENTSLVVDAYQRQIEQALLNIYINAWQAMPSGGNLYLQTRTVELDKAFCDPHQVKPGKYVRISITDTGIGMDNATCRRIFDPFFTTKKKERGTGLGLASAYGIIKNHGGLISVDSKLDHGTTFEIYLPLSRKSAQHEPSTQNHIVRGSETILLVDDENIILDVGKAMLEKLGYHVVEAKGGEKAIRILKENTHHIDMVILDLIMPEMDGDKAFDMIRKIRPDMRVMLSSGYAINGQAERIMKKGCNGFIQKPFTMSDLSKKLREVLDYNG